jgi:hypothetical protein
VTDNGRAVVENNQVGGAHHRTGGQQCVRHAPMRLLVHWRLACNVRIGHVRTTRGMQRAVSHWDRLGCSESQGLWHAHCVPPCMSFGRVWCGLYRAPPVTPPAPGLGSLRRHIGTGTGITPRPHRHRDRDHPAATSAPGPGSPRGHIGTGTGLTPLQHLRHAPCQVYRNAKAGIKVKKGAEVFMRRNKVYLTPHRARDRGTLR